MSPVRAGSVRPAIRRATIAFVVVLLPLAFASVWDAIETRRLTHEIQKIRDRGEPVTERDMVDSSSRTAETPDADAYYAAATLLVRRDARVALALRPIHEWLAGAGPRPQLADLRDELDGYLQDSRDALALADRAAAQPFTGAREGTTDDPYGLVCVAHLMALRTVHLSLSGQAEAAVGSAICALGLRRALRNSHGPIPDNHETAAVLSLSAPSPESLVRLQGALEAEGRPDQSAVDFMRYRARYVELIWREYYRLGPDAPLSYERATSHAAIWMPVPTFTRHLVGTLRTWAELLEVVKMPWPQKRNAAQEIIAKYSPRAGLAGGGHANDIDVALGYFKEAVRPDTLIKDRSALVAVAIERFRRDHSGAVPQRLAQLVPHYLRAVPTDPLSGRDLLFAANADSYSVYSIGPNMTDDRGDFSSELALALTRGWGSRQVGGGDVGVRVVVHH